MSVEQHFTDGVLNPPASEEAINQLVSALGRALPVDYVHFLTRHDGGEGFVGENYVILWKAEELVPFNREYEVDQYAPGILLFGSNGGGEGYGFDTKDSAMPIVRVPFIGMERRYATLVASSFTNMFGQMVKQHER